MCVVITHVNQQRRCFMNTLFQYFKVNVFIVALFGLVALTSVPMVQAQETTVNIEGSWFFTVTPPAAVRPPFHVLVSFSAGGVFFANTQNDLLSPVASPQHGSWTRLSDGNIGSTPHSFIHSPTRPAAGTTSDAALSPTTHHCQ